uniref:Uncharacterized protein n=1 Tax=Kalmanozyma brasiliensis (strain GHG001) TaxID=1365824 RepID=V5E546_KALBG
MQALPSKAEGNGGWLQISVRALGLYAQTSTPAYCLAALFALSSPFGFASPAQAAAEAAVKAQHPFVSGHGEVLEVLPLRFVQVRIEQ